MNKNIYFLIPLFLFVMASTQAKAQALNPELRSKRTQSNALNLRRIETGAAQTVTKSYSKPKLPAANLLSSNHAVTNNVEKIYDQNHDGKLEQGEVRTLLNDVVLSAQRRGDYKITSDLLKGFDKNNDGAINSSEIKSIEDLLK